MSMMVGGGGKTANEMDALMTRIAVSDTPGS